MAILFNTYQMNDFLLFYDCSLVCLFLGAAFQKE